MTVLPLAGDEQVKGDALRIGGVVVALVVSGAIVGVQAPTAEASGPGYPCPDVTPIDLVQTGTVDAEDPFDWYEHNDAPAGTTYTLVVPDGQAWLLISNSRYLGWGWKCPGSVCDQGTSQAGISVASCTPEGGGDRWIGVFHGWDGGQSADYVLTATAPPGLPG